MSKIKTKEIVKGTIKTLDKGAITIERTKDAIVNVKEKSENLYNDDTRVNEYIDQKANYASNRILDEGISKFNIKGKKSVIETKNNIIKAKEKNKSYKLKQSKKRNNVNLSKGIKFKRNKADIKNNSKLINNSVKTTQRGKQLAQETIKKTTKSIKAVVKVSVSAVKAIIVGTKALISALLAGGWIAFMIIIIICLVGLLFNSIFGIFFSSENTGNNITMNNVVNQINEEMVTKIINIQNNNSYDEYEIIANRAEWKDILAIYTVKMSNGEENADVMTLDDNKINILKNIFWDMNKISSEIKVEIEKIDEETTIEKRILYINITSKTLNDMIVKYSFNTVQKEQLDELLSSKYDDLWNGVIYGISKGDSDMVKIALSQVGNVGGQPYWSWYGFNSRVEWCACFVSWVADQAGYIEKKIIPKFSGCQNGIDWFKAMGQWKDKGFIPKSGDIIFFDWEVDGKVNHVGIVEKVENGKVYTIEGNSTNDTCRQKEYNINSKYIYGYGTPVY